MKANTKQLSLLDLDVFNPEDGTFINSHNESLQFWYPYLEGYSNNFVKHLLKKYMPKAKTILDPFAGTGSSIIACSYKNINSVYCEINPVLRKIIECKIAAFKTKKENRLKTSKDIESIIRVVLKELESYSIAEDLDCAYYNVFNKSIYFSDKTYKQILRYRSLCDDILREDTRLGQLCEVAALSNLIPASYLKRAGDVRYKTKKELKEGLPSFRMLVAEQLRRIAHDLRIMSNGLGQIIFASEDARSLNKLNIDCCIDGVITSPPYLNGTNYIRNTKLELWFTRNLLTAEDLRFLRDRMIVSGITDVTKKRNVASYSREIESVVSKLKSNNYDSRIPKMIIGYFNDMENVLNSIYNVIDTGAIVCIDIGDSKYGGIEVSTPYLLAKISERIGFKWIDNMHVRDRISRDRTLLKQQVIVLKKNRSNKINYELEKNWNLFFKDLPHKNEPYCSRNWGHPNHSACSYRGKLKPSIAHFLVKVFTKAGDTILDPFSGAGTIPFESALQGRHSIAYDISRMGSVITRSKIEKIDHTKVYEVVNDLLIFITKYKVVDDDYISAQLVDFNSAVPNYFHKDTLREILAARRFFLNLDKDTPETSLVLTAMLHILHGNRPYTLSRRSHPITPFAPKGDFEYRDIASRLKAKVKRMLAGSYPPEFTPGEAWCLDACNDWPQQHNKIDAIITSPPFAGSTRFYMQNWMRFWFCGWEKSDFNKVNTSNFIEDKQKNSFESYRKVLTQAFERLNNGGVVLFHLGESKRYNMAKQISEIASNIFNKSEIYTEDVQGLESHGVSDKGGTHSHQYLIMYN